MVGYFNTTGLKAMDYRVTDDQQDPPGASEHLHSETLLRFAPTCWCYSPDLQSPPVAPTPTLKSGFVTFGSLNKLIKISDTCAKLWAAVLDAVPGSRLLLATRSIQSEGVIRERLSRLGLASERIDLVESTPGRKEYLERFGNIDIALDTFPFNGITTSCDGLWMGVPLVSLAGQTSVSRAGRSILRGAGLDDLAADSTEDFVRAAVSLATNQSRLAKMRLTMRDRLLNSPLMNHKEFTRLLEMEYVRVWKKWLHNRDSTIHTAIAPQ